MNKSQFSKGFSGNSFDFTGLFFNCLRNWYWFVVSLVVCLLSMFVYLKTIVPTYKVESDVLITYHDNSISKSSGMSIDVNSLSGVFGPTGSFDNELVLIGSRSLAMKAVTELELYISYEKKGLFRNEPLYKNSPVNVWISPEEAGKLPGAAEFIIKLLPNNSFDVTATLKDKEGEEFIFEKRIDAFPALLSTPFGSFSFSQGSVIEENSTWVEGDMIIAHVSTPISAMRRYNSALQVVDYSKVTTIVTLAINNSSKHRGIDYINKIVELYNKDANDTKNEIALRSSKFINERVEIINKELGVTESELESFKREAGITDIDSDARLALQENSVYNARRVENNTQLRLVAFLKEYANNPDNINEVLPINVGLSNSGLSQLISSYNEMLLERKRMLISSSENNPSVRSLNVSIESMRHNVLTTINSVEEGLLITQKDIERESGIYAERINSAPAQEREFVNISRQREMQSALYLILLQKREENALTLAAVANNARIFNEPLAAVNAVAPNKKMYLLLALFLGFGIPLAVIQLLEFLRFKIVSREDVEKITSTIILGEIPSSPNKLEKDGIVIKRDTNDMMMEAFRFLRTNLLYMFKENQNVVMVTSTGPSEGKSFISANTALSLALLNKKVVVIGLDIRKPGLNKAFNLTSKGKGMTDYLSNPSIDILSLAQPSGVNDNLSIILGGAIPPNPTELVSGDALINAINILKSHYDYVVIDTAPIGLVTDTQIIANTADVTMYVCRAGHTNKSDYTLINELARENKLPSLTTVINNVNISNNRYGSRKLGYSYSYGYGEEYNRK